MSVESLIAQHGVTVSVRRATASLNTWNALDFGTYSEVATHPAFVQPRSSSVVNFADRDNLQRSVTFYFAGQPDIVQTDVLTIGSSTNVAYQVVGIRTPINRPTTSANCHTIVDAEFRNSDQQHNPP